MTDIYSRKFRRFHPVTVNATKDLMRNWATKDEEQRWEAMEDWLYFVNRVYRYENEREATLTHDTFAGFGYYSPMFAQIHMARPSITTLLHEFRHHMQVMGAHMIDPDHEEDARAWSLSLYRTVAPNTYRRLVGSGMLLHVSAD